MKFALAISIVLLASICSQSFAAGTPPPAFKLSKDCRIAQDQMGAFGGPVRQTMNLLADIRFNKDQKKAIQAAVNSWNTLGSPYSGWSFFKLSFVSIPVAISGATSFSCSEHYGGTDFMYLVPVSDNSQWDKIVGSDQKDKAKWSSGEAERYAPGVTHNCVNPISHVLDQKIILINTNTSGIFQFQSIVLHELGHALGLGHSCDKTDPKPSRPDFVACKNVPLGSDYHDAVMYPHLRPKPSTAPFPERKETPTKNDLARLQCLYGPK